jgi:hypothetical protein
MVLPAHHHGQWATNRSPIRENGTWTFPWTGTGATGSVTVTVTDGTFVAFDSTGAYVGAAIVKGSNDANVYYYAPPGVASDSGLASPPVGGGAAGLSNLTFCGFTGPEDEFVESLRRDEDRRSAPTSALTTGTSTSPSTPR